MSLGLGHELAKETEKARYYYKRATELCPNDEQARQYYERFQQGTEAQEAEESDEQKHAGS